MDSQVSITANKPYVYVYTYPDGKVFYVGKGRGTRLLDHETEARTGKTANRYKVGTIRKIWANGEEVGKKILAYFDNDEDALEYEIALIFFLPGLTNLTNGGEEASKVVWTQERREHMRSIFKGKPVSEATRKAQLAAVTGRKQSQAEIENHREKSKGNKSNTGRHLSPQHRENISKANKGRVVSEETRHRRSASLKGKKLTEEQKQHLSKIQKGKKLSEAHRQHISDGGKGRVVSEATRKKISDAAYKQHAARKGLAS